MGRIIAPYGILGWVKIKPDTAQVDGLRAYSTWWLGEGDDWREVKVLNAKAHNDSLVALLEHVDNRDAAFALKGKQIAVPRTALPSLMPDEYYWSDLIGLQVTNLQEVSFGVVTDVFETGANDVIVVTDAQTKQERLIPFIGQTVLQVDLSTKQMQVDWDADF